MEIFNDLVRDIKNDAKKSAQLASSSVVEIGKITSFGLQLNNFKHPIKDYKTLDHLKLDKTYFTLTESKNKVETPYLLRPLAVGDIVLVASFENDFIVIGRIS